MRWTLKAVPEKNYIENLVSALGVSPMVAYLLAQREVTSFAQAKSFFRPQLEHLHDPFLMKDMQKAINRIQQAFDKQENILVYGDYDVDGTTAVALMATYLSSLYANIATYIPDRYNEGYGLSYQGIAFARDNDFSLIIALDCGIKAVEKVAYAKTKGIDFIICDHHTPGEQVPNAVAVLDPKQKDCTYPYKELCGCGVGFKLIQALSLNYGQTITDLLPYLDLVATAIGADIVPITGENRVLAYYGLQVINTQPRPGIKALIAQVKKQQLTITDVVFIIAPRINAAGRIEHGQNAVSLLMENNVAKASELAQKVEALNTDRKDLDKEITAQALKQIKENNEEKGFTTVVYNENWHKGVIGIVASRLIETYHRPTLVFTKSGDKLAASARSVSGFSVYNALDNCSQYLEQFGGHKYAAGLTLNPNNYAQFKNAFEGQVAKTINPELLTPEIKIDAQIELEAITPKFYRILKQFAPFGPSNLAPVFLAKGVCLSGPAKCVGEKDKHLKLTVNQGKSAKFGAIGFNLGHKLIVAQSKATLDIVFTVEENHWNNQVSLQLKLKDLR